MLQAPTTASPDLYRRINRETKKLPPGLPPLWQVEIFLAQLDWLVQMKFRLARQVFDEQRVLFGIGSSQAQAGFNRSVKLD